MSGSLLSTVILPLSLFVIMLGLGLGLKVNDFKYVMVRPKAVLVGLSSQMIMLPLLAFFIIWMLDLHGALAMGLMILALCPGGTTSNLFTYIAKGDVALSVTLTAFVSVIAPFTIPLVAMMSMEWIMGEGQSFDMPVLKTIIQLMVITVLPISIGMFIHKKAPEFSFKAEKPIRIFSILFLALIVALITLQNRDTIVESFMSVGLASLLLNIISMMIGFYLAKVFVLNRQQEICIAMEVGIQNGTTAIVISLTILQNEIMAIAPTVYSLIMFATGGLFAWWINHHPQPQDAKDPATL